MYYIVYNKWDSTGSEPTAFKFFSTEDQLAAFIVEMDIRSGQKYEIVCIIHGGERLVPIKKRGYDFEVPGLQKDDVKNLQV
jgi:hypothetical protein